MRLALSPDSRYKELLTVTRRITHHYRDPLDLIWIRALTRLNIRLNRSDAVFASWHPETGLTIATPGGFDADDSLAQMILHELCHALVGGPASFKQVDWGLSNTDTRDMVLEHACHRLQAALADAYGLREFLAVTTEWRPYWDALPADPLKEGDDPAIELARQGHLRAQREPYLAVLRDALSATAALAEITREHADADSLWSLARRRHPSGFPMGSAQHRCGQCAWAQRVARSEKWRRCRQAKLAVRAAFGDHQPRVRVDQQACERFEPQLSEADCGSCGACCREGFDLVPVSRLDPFRTKHAELCVADDTFTWLPRPEGRCVALRGDGHRQPFRCGVYDERPRSCSEFMVGGDACLLARQRVGISR